MFLIVVVGIVFSGCSMGKSSRLEPYPSNAHLYKNILQENRVLWSSGLESEMEEFKKYGENTLSAIDAHRTYLERIHNIRVVKVKKKPTIDGCEDFYENIVNDEYKF